MISFFKKKYNIIKNEKHVVKIKDIIGNPIIISSDNDRINKQSEGKND